MSFFVNFFLSLREKLGGSLATSLYLNSVTFAHLSRLALCVDMVDCCGPYWVWDQSLFVRPGSGMFLAVSCLEAGSVFSVGRVWRLVAGSGSVLPLVSAETSASMLGLSRHISVWVSTSSGSALFGHAQGLALGAALLCFGVVGLGVARRRGLASFFAP